MPQPLSTPMFGHAVALVDQLDSLSSTMSLEDLRIVESALGRLISARRLAIASSMRARGLSWQEVGQGLGISTQAAHKAFSALIM